MPDDRDTWHLVLRGLDEIAGSRYARRGFAHSTMRPARRWSASSLQGLLQGGIWELLNVKRAFSVCMRAILAAFYSHPWAWNEIGFGGPAYPRGYMRLGPLAVREPYERPGATDEDPVGFATRRALIDANILKGSRGPAANDSRFLLDVHRRDLPGEATMRRYADDDEVDLCIVGAGAGGSVLAQRLARHGWRIVILEAGPFWHPDEDWVSDEAGSHDLYWTQKRIIGGADPIELGKNNSGRGVGGSMVHYAGYTPRFHPSDFETKRRDGVGADWPIAYADLRDHYAQVERELPVAGQNWPWGDPHSYPFSPHPVSGAASLIWKGALACGIEMRVGPVGIVNGTFGNRPHCIYRGFCLQGCKVNAKASPFRHPPARCARTWRRGARELHGGPRRGGSVGATRDWVSAYVQEREASRADAARSSGRGLRILDRIAPSAPELDQRQAFRMDCATTRTRLVGT